MPRPSAREQVLDAYEDILIEHGADAVTLEVVAAKANVSKGGLLYHFASKEALRDGLIERLAAWTKEYVATARRAPEGAVRHYLRTSLSEMRADNPKFRTTLAIMRLYLQEPKVAAAARACLEAQRRLLAEHLPDARTADLVAVVGEGLLFRAISGSGTPPSDTPDEVLERITGMLGLRSAGKP